MQHKASLRGNEWIEAVCDANLAMPVLDYLVNVKKEDAQHYRDLYDEYASGDGQIVYNNDSFGSGTIGSLQEEHLERSTARTQAKMSVCP